jgi:hypothetical protein
MLWHEIMIKADAGGSSDTTVVSFDGIAILTPRWKTKFLLATYIASG